VTQVSPAQKAEFVTEFLRRVNQETPSPAALGRIKKVGGCLSKGFPGSSCLRARIHASRTISEFFDVMQDYFEREMSQNP
jgi:hypothetical protein